VSSCPVRTLSSCPTSVFSVLAVVKKANYTPTVGIPSARAAVARVESCVAMVMSDHNGKARRVAAGSTQRAPERSSTARAFLAAA